jgi:hypothetical protein
LQLGGQRGIPRSQNDRRANLGVTTCVTTSLIRKWVDGSRPLLALTKLAPLSANGAAEA